MKLKRRLRLVALATCILLVAACGDGTGEETTTTVDAGSETTTTAGGEETTTTAAAGCDMSETFTREEVAEATAPFPPAIVFDVPKCFEGEPPTLAFLAFDLSIPILFEYNEGVEAAAEFYGVEILVSDLGSQTAETMNVYEALTARDPDVIGTMINASDSALYQRVLADDRILLLAGPSFSDPPADAPSVYPVDIDAKMGAEVGALLGEVAAERLQGEWSGRNVVFIGVGDDDTPIVKIRTDSALEAAREHVEIEDEDVVRLDTDLGVEVAQSATLDALTAHPDDVVIIAPLNDETGVAAAQAVRDAGREADAIVVLHGGGEFGRDAIRNDTDNLIVGAIFQSAMVEGWAWVQAAIALHLGEEFEPLHEEFPRITPDNIAELFPND